MFYSLFFKLYDQFFYVLIKTTWTTWDILDLSLLPLNNGLNKCSLFESVAFSVKQSVASQCEPLCNLKQVPVPGVL